MLISEMCFYGELFFFLILKAFGMTRLSTRMSIIFTNKTLYFKGKSVSSYSRPNTFRLYAYLRGLS